MEAALAGYLNKVEGRDRAGEGAGGRWQRRVGVVERAACNGAG